jgi:hypothetical protein
VWRVLGFQFVAMLVADKSENNKMCRHCERIVEDVQHKETVHRFMQAAADGVNRSLRERCQKSGESLAKEVTPDDLDIKIEVTAHFLKMNSFAQSIWSSVGSSARVGRLLFSNEPWE